MLNHKERELICSFLSGAALADHLEDIRNDEHYLYEVLGVDKEALKRIRMMDHIDDAYPLEVLKQAAIEFNLPVPSYVMEDEDEDDDED